MMYRLTSDFDNFHDIHIDIYAVEDVIDEALGEDAFFNASINNTPLSASWQDIGGTFFETNLTGQSRAPDISIWNGTFLILSGKAKRALEDALPYSGELLPITINGTEHQMFNCRRIADIDETKSERETINGEHLGVLSIAFSQSTELMNPLCKTRFDNCSSLYCNNTFKQEVVKHKLGGLVFEPI